MWALCFATRMSEASLVFPYKGTNQTLCPLIPFQRYAKRLRHKLENDHE
jgi:hypothetical protein